MQTSLFRPDYFSPEPFEQLAELGLLSNVSSNFLNKMREGKWTYR